MHNAKGAPQRNRFYNGKEEQGQGKKQHLNQESKMLDQAEKIGQVFAMAG